MKRISKILIAAGMLSSLLLSACSTNDPDNPDGPGTTPENYSSITINADGTTSQKGVVFSSISENSFYLDYIKYEIVDSHLEIVGYDPIEVHDDVKLFGSVKYKGKTYQTQTIQKEAFKESSIKSIEIPSTVLSIEGHAFFFSNLTSIIFNEGLQEIGEYAFGGCTDLTSVSFPESLQTIGEYAFNFCSSLTSVSLPEGMQVIEEGVFLSAGLTSVSFPEGLREIGGWAFKNCIGLASVSFPESMQTIGEYAFTDCTSLKTVTCLAHKPPYIMHPFTYYYYSSDRPTLRVPKSAVDAYKNNSDWNKVFKNITGI